MNIEDLERGCHRSQARKKLKHVKTAFSWRISWYRLANPAPNTPVAMHLEATNHCNLRCKVCSFDRDNLRRSMGFMDFAFFKEMVDQASQLGVRIVAPFFAGEPLLHPELPKMIRYIKRKGMTSLIHTNAVLLNSQKAVELLDAGLDEISFSFDGERKETYEDIQRGANFENTLENILNLLQLKAQRKVTKPIVQFKVLKEWGTELTLLPSFKSKFKGLPLDALVVRYAYYTEDTQDPNFRFVTPADKGKVYHACHYLWNSMNILHDGRAVACCRDLNGQLVVGDATKSSLQDIWSGEPMVSIRETLKQKKYEKLPLCRDCHELWWRHHPIFSDIKGVLAKACGKRKM